MFNSLTGIISAKLPQSLYLTVHGIEWDIAMPDSTLDLLPAVGSRARIFTWLYHREDAMRLFGFKSEDERALFLNLLKVDGLGARAALKIMSGISPAQLESALMSEDIAILEKLPGVGKKTAQKMLLALRGRLVPAGQAVQSGGMWEDVILALVAMGYERKNCEEAVVKAAAALESDADFARRDRAAREEAVFRRSIMELSQ